MRFILVYVGVVLVLLVLCAVAYSSALDGFRVLEGVVVRS
jgi:hypothetical protein